MLKLDSYDIKVLGVLREPKNALEFRRLELRRNSAKKKWTIEFKDEEKNNWIDLSFKDAKGKIGILQLYTQNADCAQCNCEEFIHDRSNYCIHIASFQNLISKGLRREFPAVKPFLIDLQKSLSRLPKTVNSVSENLVLFSSREFGEYFLHKDKKECPSRAIKEYRKWKKQKTKDDKWDLPEPKSKGLLGDGIKLYDYQEEIFVKMVKAKRAICSMVMGAGKTLTTIACYSWYLKNVDPEMRMLIVGPKALLAQWKKEIERSIGKEAEIVTKKDQICSGVQIQIVTYQYLSRHIEEFQKNSWDILVVDEIQYVKNSETQLWKALSKIPSPYFFGLSGTVIENRLDDLYNIMEIVSPGFLGPKWYFNDSFQNILSISRNKIIYEGLKNSGELKKTLDGYVFSYDNLVLPPIKYVEIPVTLSEREVAQHDSFMNQASHLATKSMSGTITRREQMILQGLYLKARQSCNSLRLITKNKNEEKSQKLIKIKETIEQVCLQNKEKIVVFSEWTEMLSLCREMTEDIQSVLYTGGKSAKQRTEMVKEFQENPDCMIFYSSDAGGVGLDGLQLVANNVMHVELPWNPSKADQRTGRVYRTLQRSPVTCYYVVSDGEIEQRIKRINEKKREVRNDVLKGFE